MTQHTPPLSRSKLSLIEASSFALTCAFIGLSAILFVNAGATLLTPSTFIFSLPGVLTSVALVTLLPLYPICLSLYFVHIYKNAKLGLDTFSPHALPKFTMRIASSATLLTSISMYFFLPIDLYLDSHFAPAWLYVVDLALLGTAAYFIFCKDLQSVQTFSQGIAAAVFFLVLVIGHNAPTGSQPTKLFVNDVIAGEIKDNKNLDNHFVLSAAGNLVSLTGLDYEFLQNPALNDLQYKSLTLSTIPRALFPTSESELLPTLDHEKKGTLANFKKVASIYESHIEQILMPESKWERIDIVISTFLHPTSITDPFSAAERVNW